MRGFISLEDHFLSQAMQERSQNLTAFAFHLWPTDLHTKLTDVGEVRVAEMDKGEIALQVVSAVPAPESADVCRDTNEQLHQAVAQSGGRLAGFAAVPVGDPAAAADELERCVREFGFVGALVPNHCQGEYFDRDGFRCFWARAQQLDVPIYLHPSPPPDRTKALYRGNVPEEVSTILSVGGWGWHADVAVHFIKLYASGVFDEYPRLKLVLGHAGEMLPYMITRIDARLRRGWGSRRRSLKTVWAENVWVTVSGFWDLAPFSCLIRSVAKDRILYSVDYPFECNESGRDFMQVVRESGLVTQHEWDMIAYLNAENLLGLKRRA